MKPIEQVKQEVLAKCAKVCPNWGDAAMIKHGFRLYHARGNNKTRFLFQVPWIIPGTKIEDLDNYINLFVVDSIEDLPPLWLLAADLMEGIGDTSGTDQRTGEGC